MRIMADTEGTGVPIEGTNGVDRAVLDSTRSGLYRLGGGKYKVYYGGVRSERDLDKIRVAVAKIGLDPARITWA